MTRALPRLARTMMLCLLLVFAGAQPAVAQSILRDSETEALFRDASAPLIKAAGLDPKNVNVVLIQDNEINAFVATGQAVYLHSGLITAADDVGELQAVIAHELGHVAGGHSIRMSEGAGAAGKLNLATVLLAAAAMAMGAGEAGMGLMALGQQVALSNFLSFTRAQESSADLAGAKYLSAAGISGRGSLSFFKKLNQQEYRLAVYAKDSYDRTHPLSTERIQSLEQIYSKDPAWDRPVDPALEARFQRVKGKLLGFLNPKLATSRYSANDNSIPAHYARAYAYHVGAYPDTALTETEALLKADPNDPYFLELKGQILLESGRPADAIAPLREAVERSGRSPLIASMLGHALVATEKPENLKEAKQVLKTAVTIDNDNPFAWYQLGTIYEREGDPARASLAMAESRNLAGEPKLALASAQLAMQGIPRGTPDFLRAQDIAMVARAELAKTDKRYREKKQK